MSFEDLAFKRRIAIGDIHGRRNKKSCSLKLQAYSFRGRKMTRVEKDASGMTLQADISDEDLKKWLYLVTHSIQAGFTQKGIQNYLMGQFVIGGQLIEFAFVKEGREGPHAQLLKVRTENDRLQKEILELKEELKVVEGRA